MKVKSIEMSRGIKKPGKRAGLFCHIMANSEEEEKLAKKICLLLILYVYQLYVTVQAAPNGAALRPLIYTTGSCTNELTEVNTISRLNDS